jgi:LysM repeat protein
MSLRLSLLAGLLTLTLAPAAQAASHLIVPGETLSGIAAANGLSTQALASANGLRPDTFVIAGRTLVIPAPGSGPATAVSTVPAPLGGYRVRVGDTLSGIAAEHGFSIAGLAAANGLSTTTKVIAGTSLEFPGSSTGSRSSATAPTTGGGHHVVPGETLIGIANRYGVTPASLAAANGLKPDAFVIAGTSLRIPADAPSTSVPVTSGPLATGGRLSAGQIGSIAGSYGAPASLATAIAWQESGFNNNMISVANARGIMQVTPAAWDYVENQLAAGRLDPASPSDNVRAGSMLLARLLRDTGDPATAVAAYYQGLDSVRRIGMLPETRQYVANVMALRARFGG